MYCIHCGKEIMNPKEGHLCEYCSEELVKQDLDHEQTRLLNKALHNRLNKSREEVDNAMVFVTLGLTLFLVGFLFFFLSFKLPNAAAHDKVLTVTCFEFWVSMAGLAIGGAGLISGLIRVFIQKLKVQKEILRVLKAVQYEHYHHLQKNSLDEHEGAEVWNFSEVK